MDGMAPKENDTINNPMDPWGGAMQDPPMSACGPCDAPGDISFRALEVNLVQGRYCTIAVTATVSGGNLVIARTASDRPLVGFDNGTAESGNTAGFTNVGGNAVNLTRAETDAYSDGALGTNIASNWRVTGMAVEPFDPFVYGVPVGGDDSARQYPAWLRFYAPLLLAAVMRSSHIKFAYGQATGGFEMGRPDYWPAPFGLSGGELPTNGQPLPRLFVPLRLPTWAGGPNDDNALECNWYIDHTVTVAADPTVPVPALPAGASVLIPFTIYLTGDPRNAKALSVENVEALVAEKVRSALGTMGGGMSASALDALVNERVAKALQAAARNTP